MKPSLLVSAILIAATFTLGLWANAVLPATAFLPIHQSFNSPVILHLPKTAALAIFPCVAIVVIGLLAAGPALSGRAELLERSHLPYSAMLIGLSGVFLVSEAAVAQRMAETAFDVLRPVFLSVAVLLLMLGNYLGKARQNGLFGIRTPWTLGDARVWDKTHRAAGRLMVLAGLVLIPVSLLVHPPALLISLMVMLTAGPLVWAALYSRSLWRREHHA
jgi:uncharacterized membrane protein